MIKKHFRSLFFLLALNLILISPTVFLEIPLVLMLSFLIVLDLYLVFFPQLKLLGQIPRDHFSPNDIWGVTQIMKELTEKNSLHNVQCYKTKMDCHFSVCFGNHWSYSIVLSEKLLDFLSEKQLRLLLSYYLHSISTGYTFYFSLLSAWLYFINFLFAIISYPINFFKKNKRPPKIITFIVCGVLSWFTKSSFCRLDKSFSTENDFALFLMEMNSIFRLEKEDLNLHFLPISIIADFCIKNYYSLYPSIKKRVRNLIGSYPPI